MGKTDLLKRNKDDKDQIKNQDFNFYHGFEITGWSKKRDYRFSALLIVIIDWKMCSCV